MLPFNLLCLLLLFGHGTAFLVEIRSSLSELNLLNDESLEIECFFNLDESVTEAGSYSVDEIHIVRKDESDKWTELARLQSNGHVSKPLVDLQVYGNIGTRLNETFLKIYWEHASKEDLGIYRCDAVVRDKTFSLAVEESNLMTVYKHNVTLDELSLISQREIDNLQGDFDKFRRNAEKKLARLENAVKQLKNESQNQDDKSDDDVTKEDLDKLKADIQRTVLANVSAQWNELSCFRLTQCSISDVIKDTLTTKWSGKTEYPGHDDVNLDGQQDSPKPDGQQDSPKPDGQQDSPKPDDQQDSTGVQQSDRQWPAGEFALLMTNSDDYSGCPYTEVDQTWEEGWWKIHTESADENHDNITSGHHLFQPVLEVSKSGKHFVYMRFCVRRLLETVDEPWPIGAYCINRYDSTCPPGFEFGYGDVDEEDENFEGSRHGYLPDIFYFCCRDDGSPDTPVALPTSHPFYLYRFGGKCQQVKHMQVTPERILLDTENEQNQDDYQNDAHPDGKLNDLEIELCYYS